MGFWSRQIRPLFLALLGYCVHAQPRDAKAEFEVASVKPCKNEDNVPTAGRKGESGSGSSSPDTLNLACLPLRMIIQLAYIIAPRVALNGGVPELVGDPAWIGSARYQIRAKADGPTSQEIMRGPMLQALLEERFKLKIHRETRAIAIYALTVAESGLKLQRAGDKNCTEPENILRFQAGPIIRMGCSKLQRREASCTPWDRTQPKPPPTEPGQKPSCGRLRGVSGSWGGMVDILGATMAEIAGALGASGRHVIDKTGITEDFDFHLEYALDGAELTDDPGLPSIFTALGRLGLKLESAKGPGDFLVIDHVERPSVN